MARDSIAIIGLGCRYPGANNVGEFWNHLLQGVDAVQPPPIDRLHQLLPDVPGGFVSNPDAFDAEFFGITAQEAALMDPQQRVLLETAWSALEDAGYDPTSLNGTDTSVFVGVGGCDYERIVHERDTEITIRSHLGSHPSIIANRMSQQFGLCGSSVSVNTACSSALVAIELACQDLWLQKSNLAVAAGVCLLSDPLVTQRFLHSGWLSQEGKCRSFDADADGYVRGEGVGVVVLKPYAQAIADGDRVYALIKDCRSKHNGKGNGLTLPCLQSQIDLLQSIYSGKDVDPDSVLYIEANSVGAKVGDVIELKALGQVLGKQRSHTNKLRVGCVKPNIGHTEAASGLAALIKTALALYHRCLPPTIHYQSPNPVLALDSLGLRVQSQREVVAVDHSPLYAGISSFGFGGTNAHLLLEAVHSERRQPTAHPVQLVLLSAKTASALDKLCEEVLACCVHDQALCLADIAFTLNCKRSRFPYGIAIVAQSKEQLIERLSLEPKAQQAQPDVFPFQRPQRPMQQRLAFLFTGQASLTKDTFAYFYAINADFRASLASCEEVIHSLFQRDLAAALDPSLSAGALSAELRGLLGEYILYQLWRSWGINPSLSIGEGLGQYAAAVAKGGMDIETAILTVAKADPTTMLADNALLDPDADRGQDAVLLNVGSAGATIESMLAALVNLLQAGIQIDFATVFGYHNCRVVSLPTYPFAKERHWLGEPQVIPQAIPQALSGSDSGTSQVPLTGNQLQLDTIVAAEQLAALPNSSALERQLHRLWEQVLGHSNFNNQDNFFLLGGDSLLAAQLISLIESHIPKQQHGSALNTSSLFYAPTIEKLAQILTGEVSLPLLHSLIPIQPSGSRPPWFAIHLLEFRDLSRNLGADQPIYGLRYSIGAKSDAESTLPKLERLAAHYIDELRIQQPEGPYFLMGHSTGGILAYEMAVQLTHAGHDVAMLALFDTFISGWGERQLASPGQIFANLRRIGFSEIVRRSRRYIHRRLRAAKRRLPSYSAERFDELLEVKQLLLDYKPRPYSGHVVLFKARDFSPLFNNVPPEQGWLDYLQTPLELYTIPGDHASILSEPNVKLIAEKMRQTMDAFLLEQQSASPSGKPNNFNGSSQTAAAPPPPGP